MAHWSIHKVIIPIVQLHLSYKLCLELEPESGMVVSQGQHLIITKMADAPLLLLGLE